MMRRLAIMTVEQCAMGRNSSCEVKTLKCGGCLGNGEHAVLDVALVGDCEIEHPDDDTARVMMTNRVVLKMPGRA